MIGISILSIFIIPVEEDNHTGCWRNAVVRPCTLLFEPGYTPFTAGEFGDDTGVDIAALVSAPADEAGAPFNTASESVHIQNSRS